MRGFKGKKKFERIVACMLAVVMLVLTANVGSVKAAPAGQNYKILISPEATDMQEYAAKELQKYLFQLFGESFPILEEDDADVSNAFVLGTKENELLQPIGTEMETIGAQGYVLKKSEDTMYIGGYDDEGLLYGVYGLLDDHYGIGFYFSGDVIPEEKTDAYMPEVDEAKTPRQYMRGVLPWTNFPQSATVYSTEDWKFIIDQMARMRMNFLNIHNYNGQNGHNEMFHNFTYNGITSRNWNATARTGHRWFGPSWDVNEYRFGADGLYDDYDFGTDATLHNDSLDNLEVFAKGYSQFQYIIDYAHSRGVKMGLGLDIDLVMPDYGVAADAPGLPEIQAETVLKNYEDLDTLILYVSEMISNDANALARWRRCFDGIYKTVREKRPDMQIAVSGWGIKANIANSLPDDVVIAPISDYSAGFVNGSEQYPGKEYWGGPWAERDFNSSVYFYPFNMELTDTINAYQQNKDTMKGMFTLSWRLTDGVDAKMMYIAKAPWDTEEKYKTAADVYGEYAEKCYGKAAAEDMTRLISQDEKTVVPMLWSECQDTPGFSNANRSADIAKAQAMIDRVDASLKQTTDQGCLARLQKLRNRLVSAKAYCQLDQNFNNTGWEELQKDFSVWEKAFVERVDDISSLGNVMSTQNRFVKLRYLARETALRNAQTVKAPVNVKAKGTKEGAVLTWEYEDGMAEGFNIYRDGEKVNEKPLAGTVREYADTYNGKAVYTVKAVNADEAEGTASIPQTCEAGAADKTRAQIVVVSPSTSMQEGQNFTVKARVLDNRAYDELGAAIYYRALGSKDEFKKAKMQRRVRGVFTASVNTTPFADTGIEYYIEASDGDNQSVWPATAPKVNAVCSVYRNSASEDSVVRAPMKVSAADGGIQWSEADGDTFWYKIYRSDTPDFVPSPATFVTYVEKNTTKFVDVDYDFDSSRLSGKTKYYRVTTVDKYMNESIPSQAVEVKPAAMDTLATNVFAKADNLLNSRVAAQAGSKTGQVVGFIQAGGYAEFDQLKFSPTGGYNAVEVSYSSANAGEKLSVWIDGPTKESGGTKLGEANLGNTGAWESFATVTIPLDTPIAGTHDVYFVYGNGSGYFYNLDTFRFTCIPEETGEAISIMANDMMAARSGEQSVMKEELQTVTGFGTKGDRIVLGKGFRADAANATYGGGVQMVDLPGFAGMKCFAYINAKGNYFAFDKLPEGEVYLAYDKNYSHPDHKIAVYVNDEKTGDIALPEATGSVWNQAIHKVMYVPADVIAKENDSVKFVYEEVPDSNPILNGIKLFVTQKYSAKQIDIIYSNQADTKFGLYVDGEKREDIVLPNSGNQRLVFSVMTDIDNQKVELVADETNAKTTIYQIDLQPENAKTTKTVTITHNEGGTVTPDGSVEVAYGKSQTVAIQADKGYVIDNVVINGVDYGAISSYTFESLTYDASVDVTFKKETGNAYKVTVAETEHGTIVSLAECAAKGQPVQLLVQAEEGWHLKEGSLVFASKSNPDGVAIDGKTQQFSMPGEDVVVSAEFVKDEETFIITVDGKSTEHKYNDAMTITADAEKDGKQFAYWATGDEIVSYEATYKFYVSKSMEFKAVYVDVSEEVKKEAKALLTNVFVTKRTDQKSDVKFVGELVIPEGYRLVNAGLVWSSKEGTKLVLEGGLKPTYITKISDTNQFSVTIKGVPQGRFIRGSIFATISNGTETKVIYSAEERAEAK